MTNIVQNGCCKQKYASGIGLLRAIKHGLLSLTGEGGATTRSTSARGRDDTESRSNTSICMYCK